MSIPLKRMDKLEGYKNIFSTKIRDAYFIRENRRFHLLPCEIVDEYKVYQTLPDGRKIRSHSLERWRVSQDFDNAEKFILREAQN